MSAKPRIFRIEFYPPNGTYYAGQQVSGRVHLVSDAEIRNLTGIRLRFWGSCSVNWTEETTTTTVNNRTTTQARHISDDENYFEFRTFAYGDGGSRINLRPGEFSFPFVFPLPATIPSSISHDIGSVKYNVQASMEFGSGGPVKSCESSFTVFGILDLNTNPEASLPRHKSSHKHFGFLFWKSAPLSLSVHLNKSGFVPGENILISAEIDNKSSKAMQHTYAKLVQKLTFKASGQTKTTSRVVAEMKRGRIEPETEELWSSVAFPVPSLPATNLTYCSLIDAHYVLEFGVSPSGIGIDLVVEIPVLIGTVPAYERQQAANSMQSSQLMNAGLQPEVVGTVDGFVDVAIAADADGGSGAQAHPANSDFDPYGSPPPSYEETFGKY